MPSVSEVRKISLRALHKSSTQYWEKQNANGHAKQFQRTTSMPSIKTNVRDTRPNSRQNGKNSIDGDVIESQGSSPSMSESDGDMYSEDTESRPYQSVSFGFQTKATHDVPPKTTDIMTVLYNGRTHRFLLLHSRGVSSWLPGSDAPDSLKKELFFPKYKTKLLRSIIFCKKYNVYFTICSDFTLKVYNKDFHETCKTENKSMRSILHLIFNPVTDELISSGVAGTIVWKYKQTERSLFDTIKPMANYELQLNSEYPDIGGTWCTKVQLITSMQYLFYCSEIDLYAYDARDFRKLFTINNAHSAALTCVEYSYANRLLFTGSVDCEVKVWGASGGHICTLRSHSRAISSIVTFPDIPGLVFTSSLDGTIKVWSINTMDLFYSLSVFSEGINWMSVTDDGLLCCANLRKVTVFQFNAVVKFWGHARCRIVKLEILEHLRKARRLMAVGEDGSVRLFSQAKSDTLAVCTVLPPPVVSLLDNVRDVTHSRSNHLVFVLINQMKLWVYTTKTDPACRIAEWDVPSMLKDGLPLDAGDNRLPSMSSISSMAMRNFEKRKSMHRCTQILTGKTNPSMCNCVLAVFSENGFQCDTPIGLCSARSRDLLVLGLEDGRLIFADQKRRGMLYCELRASKEAIVTMKHKPKQNWLITQSNNDKCSTFLIWKLPELELLHSIQACNTTSSFAALDNMIITGHCTGHVNTHYINSENESVSSTINAQQPEHRSRITDIKSCRKRGIFCSSSVDGVIKIWSLQKILLTEIRLGEELSSCNFLNDQGDLVIGWKRHLYLIDHKILDLPDLEEEGVMDDFEKDSDIYEDPAIKYESPLKLKVKSSKITLNKYLVPYGFVKTENDDNIDFKLDFTANVDDDESERSDVTACALTDTYLSPASSFSLFGVIDAIFPMKYPHMQKIKKSNKMMLPEFGISPGTTPTESVTSYPSSEEEYQIIEDDVFQEKLPETPDVEFFEPPWLKKENVDLAKKLSTGVIVAKAIKKMSKKKTRNATPEEPQKSRFAGAQLDSRGLMKAGINVVIAVESMKQKKTPLARERPASGKVIVKKTRRPSSSRRKSLHPKQVPIDPSVLESDHSASGDFSQEEVEEIVQKTAEKLKEMGLKMTPQRKVDFMPTRHKQMPNSAVNRPGITQHTVKSGVSNKLKRKISKSAAASRTKSLVSKSGHQFDIINNKKPGTAPPLEPLTTAKLELLGQTGTLETESVTSGDIVGKSIVPVTHIHMKYRQVTTMNEETKRGEPPSEEQPKKESDEQTVTSTTRSDKPFSTFHEDDTKQSPEEKEEETNNQLHDMDYHNIRQLLERCRAGGDEDSGDDEDFAIPNLLDYDFHAIYKKDGLQFDEKWQDRMLERYLLLKLQKEQRQEAAMNKRIFLEQERHFRLLSSHPDLLQKYNEPWFEDQDALANYVLNSSLMRGDAVSPNLPLYSDVRTKSRSSKRPNTVATNTQHNPQDGFSEKESSFRFSIRSKSCDNVPDTKERATQILKRTNASALPPATPANSSTTLKMKNSATMQNLMVDRPRSSTSIPGKTRYILIKPERERLPEKVTSPSKLEEQLLRKRFPSQHLSVMKSLGRIDEMHPSLHDDNHIHEPGGRAGTPTDERSIQTAPFTARKCTHKSDTDALSVDKSNFAGMLGNSEHSFRRPNAWKSAVSDVFINPLDIVKRKPSLENSQIKFPVRSIHA